MDKLDKLLRKLVRSDRKKLLSVLRLVRAGDLKGLDVQKLKGVNFYRVRDGKFRIIFSVSKEKVKVEMVRLRDDRTYKF